MSYTKLIIAVLIMMLVGCSSTGPIDQHQADSAAAEESAKQLERYQQAITYLNYGELDKAEKILIKFNNNHPDLAGPIANLGLIELKRGNVEQAEQRLQQALQSNPRLPQALNLLGVIEQQRGNIKEAEALYKKAIHEKADYALAHYNLALLSDIYLGKIRSAVAHYEKYLELIDGEDAETSSWLEELKYTLESNGL